MNNFTVLFFVYNKNNILIKIINNDKSKSNNE